MYSVHGIFMFLAINNLQDHVQYDIITKIVANDEPRPLKSAFWKNKMCFSVVSE